MSLKKILKKLTKKESQYNFDQSFIDKNVRLYDNYSISHANILEGTYIAPNSNISFTNIGKFCSIGPNFMCGYGIHPLDGVSTSPVFYSTLGQNQLMFSKTNKIEERLPINIGNDVFIGMNVCVLDGVSIGNGAVIGAGSVVVKDVEPYSISAGSPAKHKRYRFSQKIIDDLNLLQWWNWDIDDLKLVEQYFFDIEVFIQKAKELKKI